MPNQLSKINPLLLEIEKMYFIDNHYRKLSVQKFKKVYNIYIDQDALSRDILIDNYIQQLEVSLAPKMTIRQWKDNILKLKILVEKFLDKNLV